MFWYECISIHHTWKSSSKPLLWTEITENNRIVCPQTISYMTRWAKPTKYKKTVVSGRNENNWLMLNIKWTNSASLLSLLAKYLSDIKDLKAISKDSHFKQGHVFIFDKCGTHVNVWRRQNVFYNFLKYVARNPFGANVGHRCARTSDNLSSFQTARKTSTSTW